MKKNPENMRRLRYGGTAVLLTVVFVAAVIILNVIISALSSVQLWYIDLTEEQLYSLSDTTSELLSPLEDRDDVKIHMVFCADPDTLDASYYSRLVHQLSEEYAAEFDFFDIEYIDILTNPTAINKYKTTPNTTINTSSVVIDAGERGYRLFTMNGFYQVSSDDGSMYAFKGERAITSAILALTGKNPIAYFTANHGETTTSSSLAALLTDAGYEVRDIDLTREDIDYENAQLIIVNSPLYDLGGIYDEVNEVEKIADFLDNLGNVMIFVDPDAMSGRDFPNLAELMSEWGVSYGHSVVKDDTSAISVDGLSVVAEYEFDTETTAGSILKSITGMENLPRAIVKNAMPVLPLWEGDRKSIEQSNREVSTLLYAPASAGAYDFVSGEATVDENGFRLLTITTDTRAIDNEYQSCYMLVCGTGEFAAEKFVSSASYSNSDILYAVMKVMGKVNIPTDLDARLFDNDKLVITTSAANAWTVVLTAAIPVLLLAVGAAVYFRRKHL